MEESLMKVNSVGVKTNKLKNKNKSGRVDKTLPVIFIFLFSGDDALPHGYC